MTTYPANSKETCETAEFTQSSSNKSLEEALKLITLSIINKKINLKLYDYLLSENPLSEHKKNILSIKDDETEHIAAITKIFNHYTSSPFSPFNELIFREPISYFEGIRQCFSRKLEAVELHRTLMCSLPDIYYRAAIFEILVSELRHAESFNNILLSLYEDI